MNNTHNKQIAFVFLSRIRNLLCMLSAVLSLLAATTAYAFPTGSRGGSFFFGGSSLTLKWETVDTNGLATIQLNYFEADERLCFTGEVEGIYADGAQTGTAIYELRGADDSFNTTGICYSYVSQDCQELLDEGGNPIISPGHAYECTYDVPSLEAIDTNPDQTLSGLLSGRLKVVDGTGTGHLADCNRPADPNEPHNPPRICDFLVGIGFNNPIPPNFFPATLTTDNDTVPPNVVLYANEICTEFTTTDLGLEDTFALNAKSLKLRACEALATKGDWCSDLLNPGFPTCDTTNAIGQFTNGGFNTVAGDFITQAPFNVVCVDDVNDLRNLGCEEVNLAACSDGNGSIEMPTSFEQDTICDGNPITLSFSSSDGGGSESLNVASMLNFGSPGYPGDNTTPPCTTAAIVSTPNNNEVNIWDFSSTTLFGFCYIATRNGDDRVTGSKGPDTILGGSGTDILNGFIGNDFLQGGDNTDQLFGDDGDDLLLGYECFGINASCSVVLNNGSDDDTLVGGNGNDCLDGGRGNDTATGGAGSDAFMLYGNVDNDVITDYTIGEDVFVDLTGNATATFVNGKRGAPDVCLISAGGNNSIIVEGISSKPQCENNITILDPDAGDTFPSQCAGHPYTFQ